MVAACCLSGCATAKQRDVEAPRWWEQKSSHELRELREGPEQEQEAANPLLYPLWVAMKIGGEVLAHH
jgi:hypothetical protein